MKEFEVFSVIGITATFILGLYNLMINIKSQRKYQRELIFNKQFEFFMNLQSLIEELEDNVYVLDRAYSNEQIDSIFYVSEKISKLIGQNDLIIPASLFKLLNDFAIFCLGLHSRALNSEQRNEDLKIEITNISVNVLDQLRVYIGVEHLSEENKKLVKSKF